MRTLLRALFCAAVIGAIGGCGGSGGKMTEPKKFAPQPSQDATMTIDKAVPSPTAKPPANKPPAK